MANVGYATLQIIPSVRGIGDELRRQLVGPAGDAGDDAGESAGSGFGDAFKGAMAAIGIAEVASKLGEQFTEAFNQAMEQANVKSTLTNQLGSTGKVAANQGKAVGQLFSKGVTGEFEQGAETIRAVVSGGLAPPGATVKQLTTIGTKMTDVSSTFGADMTLQSQAISAILKNHLAPDATSTLDLITVGFQKLGPNAEDLLETFQEYPVQLKKLGLDAQTSMGLFQQGIQGGARDTDIIADSLKEFSIRAIDMSATSQTAYKQLGLSATDMSTQIAKGGKGASDGLQTVLDKLRGIKDPVARNAAAVGLFGTQAEELGTSLFKLDPSKAVNAFSSVTGAADKLGKNIRSGPAFEISQFKRTVQQGLVDFIGGKVLPILSKWGGVFNSDVLPPISQVGGVLSASFLPALSLAGTVMSGTVHWFQEWGIWLLPLAILIGGLAIAVNAGAIATGISTAIYETHFAVLLVGEAVTNGFAAAQAVLNGVMALNPFVLVAIALAALVALVIVAWKNSETFRSIVTAAWEGIKTAAMAVWNGFLKPMFAGFMVGLRAIGAAAVWLWNSAIKPAFGFISTAARILATIITIVVGGPIYLVFKLLGAIAMWLWTSVFKPVFGFIGALAIWLWDTVIKPAFASFMAYMRLLGAVGMWLWNSAIKPAFNAIAAAGKWLWNTVIKPIFGLFVAGLHLLGDAGSWLYNKAIKPAFDGISTVAKWLWEKALKPAFDKAKNAVHLMGVAFSLAKDMIGKEFGKISALAKKPIAFVINTVYNKGVVPVWNKVAGAFGAPKLAALKGFAVGGRVSGPGTETSDSVLARLSKNEHVWTAREVRGAGGHGAVMAMRRRAAAGDLPGFKDGGGLFGWISSAGSALKGAGSAAWDGIKKSASWLKDTIAGSARAGVNAIVTPMLKNIPGMNSGFGKAVANIPKKMIDSMFGYAGKADDKAAASLSAAAGPGALGKWIAQAMRLTGVPGTWAGPLRTLIMRESGGNPKAINLTDSNAKAGYPSQGLMQTIPQTFAHYRLKSLVNSITDPIANIVAGIRYIKSVYGSIFNVQQAVGSTPKGYAGGTMRAAPGWAWVGERGPELMNLSGGQTILSHRNSIAAVAAQTAAARAASATAPASAARGAAGVGTQAALLEGLTIKVLISEERFKTLARAEVHTATGELVAIIDAGGGN